MFSNVFKKLSGGGKDKSSTKDKSTDSLPKTGGLIGSVRPKLGQKPSTESSTINPISLNINANTIANKITASVKPNLILNSSNIIIQEQKQSVQQSHATPPNHNKELITVSSSSALEEEVATIFSEGDNDLSTTLLKNHLTERKGNVEARVWFMLMDIYQITEQKNEFDKTAMDFAHLFSASPPSWFGELPGNKKDSMGGGKNMIIFEAIFKDNSYVEKFKDLLRDAKKENFCRINVSQCKFEQNDVDLLAKTLKLFYDLRKSKVPCVLMGDNNLTGFCNIYIKSINESKNLNPSFLAHEQLLWLLYLEVLQWKGQQNEFEEFALNFAEKFEVSPPGWEKSGVMDFSSLNKSNNNELEQFEIDKNLNVNNVNPLLDYIKKKFESGSNAEIDCTILERVDFSAAGSISFHIQELWSNPEYENRKVIFKYPNELIVVLLEMVGANEFIKIIPRNRK